MILILIIITFLFSLWFFYKFRKNTYSLPGPWNVPILGSLLWLDPQNPYISLTKMAQKFGPVFTLQLGTLSTVVISDATILKKLLIKEESTGRAPLYLLDVVTQGKGILLTQGKFWSDQRKFVVHFLKEIGAGKISTNRKIVHEIIRENAHDFVQSINEDKNLELLDHNVASVFSTIFMRKSFPRNHKNWQKILQLVHEVSALIGVTGPLNFLPFLRFLPKNQKLLKILFEVYNTLYDTSEEVIKECRADANYFGFFETYLEKTKYNEDHLCSLIIDLFSAGTETTTNSLCWIFLYLAKHKDVQDKVRKELLEVLQGKPLEIEDLKSLPYTEATISEIMRIRTVVPLGFPHCVLKDVVVEEFVIPKGTMIMPLLWAIHMDSKTWEHPEEFKPERFLNSEGRFHKPEHFLPFQTGKRMCVGKELARMTIFLFVATVVTQFEIRGKTGEKIGLEGICGLSLAPKHLNLVFSKI